MKANKRIQAFTLSELIVALIITVIVAGLAFNVLQLVQKHMLSIQDNFNKNTNLNILETGLSIDFNLHNNVIYDDIERSLILTSKKDTIYYKFEKSFIVRQTDTIPVSINTISTFFMGERVNNGKIDALKIETNKVFFNQSLFITKPNDASVFMN